MCGKIIFIVGGSGEDRNGYARKYFKDSVLVEDYQLTVKDQLLNGMNPQAEAGAFLKTVRDNCNDGSAADTDTVITSIEMGCGVVPADAFERKYREENGRVNCMIAERADTVILLICGIAKKLK